MILAQPLIVGIDPGNTGAIAAIHGDTARVWDMPVTVEDLGMHWVKRNGIRVRVHKSRTRIDPDRLARLLGDEALGDFVGAGDGVAFVEWARSSPQMGVASAFAYGLGFGMVRGVLAHLGVPTRLVTADRWKRALGLVVTGSRKLGRNEARNKHSALELARTLYPQLADQLTREKDEGRAEALLLAHYGCELLDEERAAGPLFTDHGRARVAHGA